VLASAGQMCASRDSLGKAGDFSDNMHGSLAGAGGCRCDPQWGWTVTDINRAVLGRNPKAPTHPIHPDHICLPAESQLAPLRQQLQSPCSSELDKARRLHEDIHVTLRPAARRHPPDGGGDHPIPSILASRCKPERLRQCGNCAVPKIKQKDLRKCALKQHSRPRYLCVRLQSIMWREGCGVALTTCPWRRSRHMMMAYASCCFPALPVEYPRVWTLLTSDCRCCATALVISHPSQADQKNGALIRSRIPPSITSLT